jgi:hypothetical protein
MSTKPKPADAGNPATPVAPSAPAAPEAPLTDAQLAVIDARIATAVADAFAKGVDQIVHETGRRLAAKRDELLAQIDGAGEKALVAISSVAAATIPPAEPAAPEPELRSTVHEVARAFGRAGVDLDPEQIMTDAEGWPAWAMRDGVMSVTTVDGRKVEVTL